MSSGDWSLASRRGAGLALALILCALAGCAGNKAGDADAGPEGPPPGGSGTGANGVPVFWSVLGYGTALGGVDAVGPTSDGGWVGAGGQDSRVHVLKLDARGNLVWERKIAMTGGAVARGVAELGPLAGGGYVVAGTSNLSGTETAFLLRLGPDGAPLAGWPKTFGGGARSGANGVLALGGGSDGFVAAGYRQVAGDPRNENVWLLRTDAAGTPLWERSDYADLCPAGGEFGTALAAVDGDLVVAGTTGCSGWAPFLLRFTASDGDEISAARRLYDTGWGGGASASALAAAPGGGFYLAGRVPAFGPSDAFVLRTDAAGDETWRRTFGGDDADAFDAVAATSDGGFLAVGYTRSYGGAVDPAAPWQWEDLLLVRGTADGETTWAKVKGLRPMASDGANAIAVALDGGFAVGGWCGGNTLVAKFDANGDTVSLGDRELSYVVPAHEGTIRLATATGAARAAVVGLTRPRQVGGTLLDLLVATVRGEPASAFCTGGGSYAFTPTPVPPLVAATAFPITFDGCAFGPAGDETRLDGTAEVKIYGVGGDVLGASYMLHLDIEGIDITATSVGTSLSSTFRGSLEFQRTASGGSVDERAWSVEWPAPLLLRCGASDGTSSRIVAVGPFTVNDTVAAGGAITCGSAGDTATVDPGGGPLSVTVTASLAFPAEGAFPSSGTFSVEAPDASRLTAAVGAGVVSLAVDTDGDGVPEGTLSVPWEYLED